MAARLEPLDQRLVADTLDRLLAGAHARGLRVIVNFVPAHSSSDHPWFVASRASRSSAKRDWYVWRDPAPGGGPPNNWKSTFDPKAPAWTLDPNTGQYWLHSFLPETLVFRNHENDELIEELPFVASRQAGSHKVTERISLANLFYSFGNQHPGALKLNNYPKFMQELSIPGNPFIDLAAIDILRARERGIPRYNEFRRQLNLNPIRQFEDLTNNAEQVATLREVYGDDVEKLDLLVGTLAEGHRPTNFGFGETLFQIFILNASRRLQADRFYTTDFREDVYTPEGMKWIDAASMKSVILRHYPELALTGLGNVANAFEPWDTDFFLSPERHPLRQYIPELKKNPWQGDAY